MRSRGELPHLYKEGGSYFVTFRLWDAIIPREQRDHWHELQRLAMQQPRLNDRLFVERIAEATEPALRRGSCLLEREEAAHIVHDSLLHFDQERYELAAWCVMPNHVHVAYTALAGFAPDEIHHSWKSYSAHEINKAVGRTGTLWERESFDHLIRSIEHYEAFIQYIEANPVVAGFCARAEDWPYSSAAHFGRFG
jgi:REP element-mobilizing transposase RayT